GGSLSGGTAAKSSGFLSRANDIKMLKEELSELYERLRVLKDEKEKAESERGNLEDQKQIYAPMVREYEDELLRLKSAAEHLSESISSGASSKESLEKELAELNTQIEDTNEQLGILINEASSKEHNAGVLEERVKELEEEVRETDARKAELSEENTKILMEIHSAEKDIAVYRENISSYEREIISCEENLRRYDEETESIKIKNKKSEEEIRRLREHIDELSEEYENIQARIDGISEKKQYITNKMQEIQNSNKELTEQLMLLSEQLTKLEARREKLLTEQERIISRLWDQYELTMTDAEKLAEPVEDEAEARKRAESIRAGMKALGNLNLNAVEEYMAVKERYEFLSGQKADLESSKENLIGMIREVYSLMSDCFASRFKSINESFSEVFAELFGGGVGRLYLSDPNDVLESGIEIEAQLPGKGLKNITLYSGGERSLIAIALLFAILKVKPTPFCILDEIDAALDDVNVSRFATYLKNYASVQFIIITHRRGTMEAADVLYGVTMQEKGVSKLLSLMIDDVDERPANWPVN
ncbi:MAG: hypothetical protein J1F64_07760, partial [Oscillospiraceae bacterium]|nr:hypothetical protein [Oscillospiraceae bacterium]